ncbi:MAG: (d)CMP kinase [Deltaproteobacteria bacterium]|nr:(d)CMP kinase [Deltaproteobacteria bacterium]
MSQTTTNSRTPGNSRATGRLVVSIDGPAGAGKSTVARILAERLGYDLLDTGAIYRTLALLAFRNGTPWDDGPRVAALANGLDIRFVLQNGINQVWVNGADVSPDIRTGEISDGASRVSALPEVRAALLELQRQLGAAGGVVVEGRDIGTVVFPDAEAKFFLTATVEERARRRTAELRAGGRAADEQAVLLDIVARDLRDTTRVVAPLRPAADAVEIDSSGMNAAEVVERMFDLVRSRS